MPPPQQSADPKRPLLTAIVMMIGAVTGLPILIAVVMSYLFKAETAEGDWARTHYSYHFRTFWGSILYTVIGAVLVFAGIGIFILAVLPVWVFVRALLPLLRALRHEPMPAPYSWLI